MSLVIYLSDEDGTVQLIIVKVCTYLVAVGDLVIIMMRHTIEMSTCSILVTDQKKKLDTDLFFFFSLLVSRFVWNRIATFGSLPSPRNSHVCSYQLDKMIVVGGKDGA